MDVQPTDVAVLVLASGLLTVLLGAFSSPLRRLPVTEPLVALAVGFVLGPSVTGFVGSESLLDPGGPLHVVAQVTLAVGLMAVGLRIPSGQWRGLARSLPAVLLGGMLLMWLASSAVLALVVGLPLVAALVIGAVITPTDPVVASTIVTGRTAEEQLPARLRHLISAESGLNDGLTLPLVALSLVALAAAQAPEHELQHVFLWSVPGAIVGGLAIGALGGKLLHWADQHHTIENSSFLAYSVALSLVALATLELVGMHSVLGVFMAGVGMNIFISGHERSDEAKVQDAVNRLFSIPVFVLLGVAAPVAEWAALGLAGVAALVLVLLVRRLPAMLLLGRFAPIIERRDDRLFAGWFGPIGVAALFYVATLPPVAELALAWPLASLIIVGSIVAHGVTAGPATTLYGRRRAD